MMNKAEAIEFMRTYFGVYCWCCDTNEVLYATVSAGEFIPVACIGENDKLELFTHELELAMIHQITEDMETIDIKEISTFRDKLRKAIACRSKKLQDRRTNISQ